MSVKLKLCQRDMEKHEFRGLANHGSHILECSACGEALVEIMLVDPAIPVTFNYRADCPHCGDHSFPVELTGRVIIGPAGKTIYDGHRDAKPGEPDDIMYLVTSKGRDA